MSQTITKLPFKPENMTVVVIDDQDPIRKAIKRVLTTMGFGTVLEFFDGYEAIKAINKDKTPIDLILTDLYMRRADGFQVLKKIRSKDFASDIPIIVVTGEGSKEDIIQAVDLGADDYILKPFQISDIEKKVLSVLVKYHSPPPLVKLIRQGERLLVSKEYQDALKLFEAAQRLDAGSAKAQHLKALTIDAMGHPGEALHILKESAANNSTYYKNFAAMANIYLKLDQKAHAIDSMKSELELNPRQANRQTALANMLLEQGDSLGAIDHFREALKENAKMREALIGIGKAYESTENIEKAIYYYKRARRNHPSLTLALDLIVKCFESRGQLRKAIPPLLDEISAAPNKVDARIIASNLYVRFEEMDKAAKVLDDGLIREPNNVSLMKAKAKVLMASHDYTNAVAIYNLIIGLEQTSQNYGLLGFALMHDRQYQKSIEALQAALIDAPDRQKVLSLLSEAYKRSGCPFQSAFMLLATHLDGGKTIPKSQIKTDFDTQFKIVKERRGTGQNRLEGQKKVS
ncbi:MAG: response regulator [Proteobacteria bacterium]|nr:response regulator [Pseudomonadota bacterium]